MVVVGTAATAGTRAHGRPVLLNRSQIAKQPVVSDRLFLLGLAKVGRPREADQVTQPGRHVNKKGVQTFGLDPFLLRYVPRVRL